MIAYKGFNKDLSCTKGKGTYRYEVGKTYREEAAKCAHTGFHCVEEPIEVLRWYPTMTDRYCIVEAAGDINEDGDDRISCTEMTIRREIDRKTLGLLECDWMLKHPARRYSSKVFHDKGYAGENDIVIVRGKDPRAAGDIGSTLYLVKEHQGTITDIGVYEIDGREYMPGTYYNARRRRCR